MPEAPRAASHRRRSDAQSCSDCPTSTSQVAGPPLPTGRRCFSCSQSRAAGLRGSEAKGGTCAQDPGGTWGRPVGLRGDRRGGLTAVPATCPEKSRTSHQGLGAHPRGLTGAGGRAPRLGGAGRRRLGVEGAGRPVCRVSTAAAGREGVTGRRRPGGGLFAGR